MITVTKDKSKHTNPGLSLRFPSCQVNTTSRQGIKELGISFGYIFPLFSYESSRGLCAWKPEESPGPQPVMTALPITFRGLNDPYNIMA